MADFSIAPEIKELRRKAKGFLEEQIIPNEHILARHDTEAGVLMKDLQSMTKAMGMWAMFIGSGAGGTGTGFLPYAFVNEILGRSPFASRASDAPRPTPATPRSCTSSARPSRRSASCVRSSPARCGRASR